MVRYAAFLRGMNLGRRRIANADLRRHVEALDFADVALFRASGNVIVTADDGVEADAVARRLEQGLGEALGYAVPIFLRTRKEMQAMAAFEPFDARAVAASKGRLQVTLLTKAPGARASRAALALATDEDLLAIEQTELYWLPSGGTLESQLDQKALARLLGPATMRTKGTIDQIAAKHFI